jgi:2-desacetyl-2-hydroxyethyl bacteriochlorophyllide A dehydrogenase
MKAIVYSKYGNPEEVLDYTEVEKPVPKDDEVLVKVYASSISYGDDAMVRGTPVVARLSSGLLNPKYPIPGIDIAGKVEAIGASVNQFKPGDEVYGDVFNEGFGAYAQYTAVPASTLALKPTNISYEEAATVPQYGLVALQSLRDSGKIKPGDKVLIVGASGGIGTFAVQIAKTFGAEVTGVCSTRNIELVSSLGADHVIDYTKEDFTQRDEEFDVILDIVAKQPVSEIAKALKPGGKYIAIAFSATALLRGSLAGNKKLIQFSHEPSVEDLEQMRELIKAGKVVPVIAKSFPLSETAEAFRYYHEDNPSGKVAIKVEHEAD